MIECRIFAERNIYCFLHEKINFRIYVGDFKNIPVHFKIRHFSEAEIKRGLGFFEKRRWTVVLIKDVSSNMTHRVLLNLASVVKRLKQQGISQRSINRTIKTASVDFLRLQIRDRSDFAFITSGIFNSHSPLI